jgi:hypothetical protein
MKQFWLVAAALLLTSLLPDEAFAQRGGRGGAIGGGGMGGGFRGAAIGGGGMGGGFRGAAIGGGFRGGGPGIARIGAMGGGLRGGGIAAARVGGFGGGVSRGPGFVGRSAFIGRPGFVGRSAFIGRPFAHRAFFPARRVAFFPRRRFIAPFFGAGLFAAGYGYSSCWRLVPTAFGWQRVWVCGPYGYGYGGYYY